MDDTTVACRVVDGFVVISGVVVGDVVVGRNVVVGGKVVVDLEVGFVSAGKKVKILILVFAEQRILIRSAGRENNTRQMVI